MRLILNKSTTPILWLDTFVIIKMAKILKGEKIHEVEAERCNKLLQIIESKLSERRLICIKSEQLEEVKLGGRLIDECDDIITRLSLGTRAKPPYGIEHSQEHDFMYAYAHSFDELCIDYRQAFYRDPIRELKSRKNFIISVKENHDQESNDSAKSRKKILNQELELLRQEQVSKGIKYENQLELEYKAKVQSIMSYLISSAGNNDINEYMALIGDSLNNWAQISGKKNDIEGLIKFYNSNYYNYMPYNDITAKLYANIIASNNPIETGDSMDITNIATMAPYCNIIVTDKKMRNRIKLLGIDLQYNFQVFSLKDHEELFYLLKSL